MVRISIIPVTSAEGHSPLAMLLWLLQTGMYGCMQGVSQVATWSCVYHMARQQTMKTFSSQQICLFTSLGLGNLGNGMSP